MKKSQWLELVESKKDAIMEAFMDANKESALDYLYPARHGGGIAVTMDTEGNLHSFYQQRNEITGEVFDGSEIYLGYFPTSSTWDFQEEYENIKIFLDDKFKEFKNWCEKNSVSVNIPSLRDWDVNSYENLVRAIILYTVDDISLDIAEQKFEVLKEELAIEAMNEA
jgi:hypothetical protein